MITSYVATFWPRWWLWRVKYVLKACQIPLNWMPGSRNIFKGLTNLWLTLASCYAFFPNKHTTREDFSIRMKAHFSDLLPLLTFLRSRLTQFFTSFLFATQGACQGKRGERDLSRLCVLFTSENVDNNTS